MTREEQGETRAGAQVQAMPEVVDGSGVCFPRRDDRGGLVDLMHRQKAAIDGSPLNRDPHDNSSDREPQEKRMIGDFDSSANPLWALYGKEARSHDTARIQTLKDDMDGVLIFVCSYFFICITDLTALMLRDSIGWFILCCRHYVYHRQQREPEGEPRRSDSILPATKRRDALPDLSADLLHSPTIHHPFHPSTPLPCFQPIEI